MTKGKLWDTKKTSRATIRNQKISITKMRHQDISKATMGYGNIGISEAD